MWNDTEGSLEVEASTSSTPHNSQYEESAYSLFFSMYNPNSPGYSNNITDFGISEGMLKFCVEGVGVTSISLLGVTGNIVSIIVLSSPRMKNPSSCFLLCLSVCDILTLIGSILLAGIPSLLAYSPTDNPEDGLFVYNRRIVEFANIMPSAAIFALSLTALSGSIFFTMALTLERYFAVCRPFFARFLCTWSRATFVSSIIIVISILFNLPRWWEFTYVVEFIYVETTMNYTVCRPVPTPFRMHPAYDTYYSHVAYALFLFVVPVCFLIVFNVLIYREIRIANSLRRIMSPLTKNDNSLTYMLFGVVAVFLVCQLTPALHTMYRYCRGSRKYVPEIEYFLIFMLALNSSVNFLIYCVTGAKFREVFCSIFCFWRIQRKNSHQASSTKTTFRSSLSQSRSLSLPFHAIIQNYPGSAGSSLKDGSSPSPLATPVDEYIQISTII